MTDAQLRNLRAARTMLRQGLTEHALTLLEQVIEGAEHKPREEEKQ